MLMEDIEVKIYRSYVKLPVIFFVPAALLATAYVLVYLYVNSGYFLQTTQRIAAEHLPGEVQIAELVVDPDFTGVHLFGATIAGPGGDVVIESRELHAELNPSLLLLRRIEVERAVARQAGVRMAFAPPEEGGELNLLAALGLGGGSSAPETGGDPLLRGVNLSNLRCEGCFYSFDLGFMDFQVPDITIPQGEIDIDGDNLVMSVPQLDVDAIEFRFRHSLFGFEQDYGDWRFTAEDIAIRNWRWANDGFTVESIGVAIAGNELDATGFMRFPARESDGPDAPARMIYRGRGTLSAPFDSRLGQYFVRDHVHAEIPEIDIAVEGSLETIGGTGRFHFSELETGGLRSQDVKGAVRLDDSVVKLEYAEARLHGGLVEVPFAYYDMFTGDFGAEFDFVDVDPHPLVADFGFDYPWLAGRAAGSAMAIGRVPFDPTEYDPKRDPIGAMTDDAAQPVVEVELLDDLELRRSASGVIPGSTVTMRQGARVWASLDRVGLPDATVDLDDAVVRIEDFVFDWEDFRLEPTLDGDEATIRIDSEHLSRLTSPYGTRALDGALHAVLRASGRLNYPDLDVEASVRDPRLDLGGTPLAGSRLKTSLRLDEGRLKIRTFDFDSPRGQASVTGWLDVLRDPAGLIDPSTLRPTTDYVSPRTHPAQLRFDLERIDLALLQSYLPSALPITGLGSASGQLEGTLEDPAMVAKARTAQATLAGQPLEAVEIDGSIASKQLRVDRLLVDAGEAGRLEGRGAYGFDGAFEAELRGEAIDLVDLVAVREASPVPIRGVAGFELHGSGTAEAPKIGGHVILDDAYVAGRSLGDLSLVTNTLGETIHLSGALRPWSTVDLEIPLDADSPFYARLGLDHMELTDAVPELRMSRIVERAEASGTVEIFLDRDLSRYQILANLDALEVDSLGQRFHNRGPIIAGLNDGVLLQIQQATIGQDDRFVTVRGGIALEQALIDLSLEGDLDLGLVNAFRQSFPEFFPEALLETRGVVAVDASIRGTPEQLLADGFARFGQTDIVLRDIAEPIVVLGGEVRFGRNGLRIDAGRPVRGRALGGVFTVTGSMGFDALRPEDLQLEVWTHNMSVRVPEVANLTFDTRLSLRAPDLDRPDTWRVSGDVDVVDGLYYENISIFQKQLTNRLLGAFNKKTEAYEASLVEQLPMFEDILFDVNVHARDGFRIQNEIDRLELDLEFRVDVRLQNTLVDPRLTGDIDVIDGRVDFQGERFEVRNGTLTFGGDPSNPVVDLIADADVRNRCRQPDIVTEASTTMSLTGIAESEDQQIFHVILNVRGPLDNMDIQFEAVPYADQRDILSLLLTGCTVDQLTASSASSPTLEVALGPVLGWIEGQVQDAVEVEEFTITPSVDRLKTTVGDTFTRRLSWRLQLDTGLTEAAGGQQYQLEYRLSDSWSAQLSESSRTDTNNFLIDLKLKYRLLLD